MTKKNDDLIDDEFIDDENGEDEIDMDDDSVEIEDEIYDDDDSVDSEEEDVFDKEEETNNVVLSKHTLQGKHSLRYDSIFKGKKEDPLTEDDIEVHSNFNDNFEVDKSSMYWFESVDNENYIKDKRLKEKVYQVLSEHTDINFLNNRRKPSKVDFNNYYYLLRTNLQNESFTNIELFNELAVYFSDNLFNMFKLLDNKWRNLIISELQDHIGKQTYSNEVITRNIHQGTEIEFLHDDINSSSNNKIHITGVVIEADYELSTYKVNSYEKIYEVKIEDITKILNNTKFKYNLNKLNHIDFL